nr:MAG: nonstructural protein [Avian astrovirus 5]
MVARLDKVDDPLNHLLDNWEQDQYTSTTWTPKAYTRVFEKFHYATPAKIQEEYKDLWDFATEMVLDEYSYMQNSVILPITATEKQMRSTPAFPKFIKYDTEEEFIQNEGWREYVWLWENYKESRPLWWCFLKNETLKVSKVESDDIRMILCTDPTYTRMGASFDQHQNALMKNHTLTHQAQTGWTPFYGGLDKRLRRLEKGRDTFVELDWTRFDGTIPKEVFLNIKEIRWFFHHPKDKTPENEDRYWWYVDSLINKLILLPTGEVTLVTKGNPSGQISTTTDNNMVNTFLTAFEVAYYFKKQTGRVPTVKEYRQNVDSICYGDDRILAYNSSWVDYDVNDVPRMYKEIFGMWVKPENIKKQNDLAGLSFCGFKFFQHDGQYLGVPNVDKVLSTIEHPVRKLPDVTALWGKLQSLRILCEYAGDKAKSYLDKQLYKVQEYCKSENIELPEVPADFYSKIWTGGPK